MNADIKKIRVYLRSSAFSFFSFNGRIDSHPLPGFHLTSTNGIDMIQNAMGENKHGTPLPTADFSCLQLKSATWALNRRLK
jgi:hypothetical protein